ncbi:dethiobiotin synthase [Buchnera aphidicola]|uniref:dethiobiotin synthase n=1 Tax=Buchnera aphidicola TaxID=9 RepID=UPI00223865D0|nr:dethiobiotin synthase [Buchnera aphidicola]MCW5197694.1 dethiobiotin synthase [Buchnera aphidicola (Chaitophorus viminalis)]
MKKKFFITGTDTNVGKTLISCILLKKAQKFGFKSVGYKPISSGLTTKKYYKKINEDAYLLNKYSFKKFSLKDINPINFKKSIPPHIASKINKKKISLKKMSHGLNKISKKSNWILIEGAGGWHTPLSNKKKFSDWVISEKLPVLIVVAIKIGCINHAILTKNSIINSKLKCLGWIANNIYKKKEIYYQEYIKYLKTELNIPFIGEVNFLKNKKINIKKIKLNISLI